MAYLSFNKTDSSKVVKNRLQILKEIHRKKVIEKVSGGKTEEPIPVKLPPIDCKTCGEEFTPELPCVKFCKRCRIERETPAFHKRAKQWEKSLKKKFKSEEFTKEDVNKFFKQKFSFETIRKVLYMMSYNGTVEIVNGNFKNSHRYKFPNENTA